MTPADEIAKALDEKASRGSNGWWNLRCPLHEDSTASLGIKDGDTAIVVKCQAGCESRDLLTHIRELGFETGGKKRERPQREAKPTIVQAYDYRNGAGELVYQVVRYHPKTFRQRRPDGSGGWIWKMAGVDRVLYRLPEILQAVAGGRTIYVVEGEKDADSLSSIGIDATCNSGGAGKWSKAYSKTLEGARVVILPDKDKAGRDHAAQVMGMTPWASILELPGNAKDPADWIAAGGTREQLERLSSAEPPASELEADSEENEDASILGSLSGFAICDQGAGERFAFDHLGCLIYVADSGHWRAWDGRRWAEDFGKVAVNSAAKRTANRINEDAMQLGEGAASKTVKAWVKKCHSTTGRENMVKDATSEPGMHTLQGAFDLDPWKLNVANGVLDLKALELIPHSPEHRQTKLLDIAYDREEPLPMRWLGFLDRIMAGNSDLIGYLQRAVGYCLTGTLGEDVMMFLHGSGANGKTVFIRVIQALLGEYSDVIPTEVLMDAGRMQKNGASPDIAKLQGVRLVVASETHEAKHIDEQLVKQLTGRDLISARRLYSDSFTFAPTHKLILVGNHKPEIRGTDEGIWRRIHLVPFTVTIPEAERDGDLGPAIIREELPGILAWAVTGCEWWQREGLNPPPEVCEATEDYRSEMDILGAWIEERCETEADQCEGSSSLYQSYKDWMDRQGQRAWSQRRFSNSLALRGFRREKGRMGTRFYGIALTGTQERTDGRSNAYAD